MRGGFDDAPPTSIPVEQSMSLEALLGDGAITAVGLRVAGCSQLRTDWPLGRKRLHYAGENVWRTTKTRRDVDEPLR